MKGCVVSWWMFFQKTIPFASFLYSPMVGFFKKLNFNFIGGVNPLMSAQNFNSRTRKKNIFL